MRNVRFWHVISLLVLAVFMFSGCGGSLDDATDDTGGSSTKVYSTEETVKILGKTWRTYSGNAEVINDTGYTDNVMRLESSKMVLSDVAITGNTGTLTLSSDLKWKVTLGTESTKDKTVQLPSKSMKIAKAGTNQWRCTTVDKDDDDIVEIYITVSSDIALSVSYEGETTITNDKKETITLHYITSELNYKNR